MATQARRAPRCRLTLWVSEDWSSHRDVASPATQFEAISVEHPSDDKRSVTIRLLTKTTAAPRAVNVGGKAGQARWERFLAALILAWERRHDIGDVNYSNFKMEGPKATTMGAQLIADQNEWTKNKRPGGLRQNHDPKKDGMSAYLGSARFCFAFNKERVNEWPAFFAANGNVVSLDHTLVDVEKLRVMRLAEPLPVKFEFEADSHPVGQAVDDEELRRWLGLTVSSLTQVSHSSLGPVADWEGCTLRSFAEDFNKTLVKRVVESPEPVTLFIAPLTGESIRGAVDRLHNAVAEHAQSHVRAGDPKREVPYFEKIIIWKPKYEGLEKLDAAGLLASQHVPSSRDSPEQRTSYRIEQFDGLLERFAIQAFGGPKVKEMLEPDVLDWPGSLPPFIAWGIESYMQVQALRVRDDGQIGLAPVTHVLDSKSDPTCREALKHVVEMLRGPG